MSENTGVGILADSEFSGFELKPMDLEAWCKTILTIDENEDGIDVVIEGVTKVKDKTFQGRKKPAMSYKLVPQDKIPKAWVKNVVDGKIKDKKTGEMKDVKVYELDKLKNPVFLKAKDYDQPIHISLTFKERREIKCEISEKYPDGKKDVFVVAPLGTAHPLLNHFLQAGGVIPEGNKQGFFIDQENLDNLENFEFKAGCEVIKLEGLKPYQRITAKAIEYDFSNSEKVEESGESSESEKEDVESSESDEYKPEDEW